MNLLKLLNGMNNIVIGLLMTAITATDWIVSR